MTARLIWLFPLMAASLVAQQPPQQPVGSGMKHRRHDPHQAATRLVSRPGPRHCGESADEEREPQ